MNRKIAYLGMLGFVGAFSVSIALAEDGLDRVQQDITSLKSLIEGSPNNGSLYMRLGKNYILLQDFKNAEEALKKARDLHMSEREWMQPLARMYLKNHQYRILLQEIQLGSNWLGEDAFAQDILMLRAHAHANLHEDREARRLYEDVLKLNPNSGESWHGLAMLEFRQGHLEAANNYLSNARTYQYDDPALSAKISSMQYKNNDNAVLAYQDYSKRLRNTDTKTEGLFGLTYITLLNENEEELLLQARALYQHVPNNPEAAYLYALAAYQKGQGEEAKKALEHCLRLDPYYLLAQYLLVKIYCEQGDFFQARVALEKLRALDPNNNIFAPLLSIVEFKLGFFEKAHGVLADLRKNSPEDFRWAALEGSFVLEEKQLDKALEYYQTAATLAQGINLDKIELKLTQIQDGFYNNLKAITPISLDPFIYKDVIYILQALDTQSVDVAMDHAKAFVETKPGPLSDYLRARAAQAMGDHNDALYFYEQALRAKPDFLAAMNQVAQCYIDSGDYRLAEETLSISRDMASTNPDTYLLLAKTFELQNKDKETVLWLKEAVKKNPERVEPAMALVMFYYKKGSVEQAFDLSKETMANFPENTKALEMFANIALKSKYYDDALSAYTRLDEKFPNNTKTLLAIAECLLEKNQDTKASDTLDRVFRIEASNIPALLLSARIEQRKAHYESVMELAEKVLYQDPNSLEAYEYIAMAYSAQGNLKKTLLTYDEAFSKVPVSSLAKKIYTTRVRLGDINAALDGLEDWMVLHPADVDMRLFLAEAYESAQEYPKAVLTYEHLLIDKPNDNLSLRKLAKLYGRYDTRRAIDFAERAYVLDPKNIENADTFAWALVSGGNLKKGLRLLEESVQRAPDNMEVRYHLALAKNQSGDLAGAREELAVVLKSAKSTHLREEAHALFERLPKESVRS